MIYQWLFPKNAVALCYLRISQHLRGKEAILILLNKNVLKKPQIKILMKC